MSAFDPLRTLAQRPLSTTLELMCPNLRGKIVFQSHRCKWWRGLIERERSDVALTKTGAQRLRIIASIVLVTIGATTIFTTAAGTSWHLLGYALLLGGSVGLSLAVRVRRMELGYGDPSLSVMQRKLANFKQTWPLGLAVILLVAFSCYELHLSAITGATEVWPVYLFTFSGLALMAYWLFLTSSQPR